MDFSALAAVVGGIQQSVALAQGALQFKSDAEVRIAMNEMLDKLTTAYQRSLALGQEAEACAKRVHDLEKSLHDIQDFDRKARKYTLTELAPGAYAFVQKREQQMDAQPAIPFCAGCMHKRIESILQFDRYEGRFQVLKCHTCQGEIKTPHGYDMSCQTAGGLDMRGF